MSFLGALLPCRRFITGSVSAAASWDHHVEVSSLWLIPSLVMAFELTDTHPSLCQCRILAQEVFPAPCPVSVFRHKISLWTPFQSNSARIFPLIFRLIFHYFDLFVLPHAVWLSPQLPVPMALFQHFTPYLCIKCSISPIKPFLEKASSPGL